MIKESTEAAAKKKALSLALEQVEKQYGKGVIMQLGHHAASVKIDHISTGSLTLDLALGIGGLPRGRVVEIYGSEASGKTTLALQTVANAQKAGGVAAYIDVEHAIDPAYAKIIGVDLDELFISQPDSGEAALNIAETLVRSNAVDIIVIDSVAALVPRAEIEGEIGDTHIGLQARMMSQALRKLTAAISKSKTCCVFINQIRMKIGVMFGNPETTPGGRALKFYASIRINMRRIAYIKDSAGEAIGSRTKAKIVKNKVAPPFRTAEFDIMYNEGISWTGSVLDLGVSTGVIEKKGSSLSFKGASLGRGRERARELLKGDKKLTNQITAEIKKKLAEKEA
ncbi:MAG: recombinase RecA [Candidatus Euphemobacter frigidus]|nr:recombinase RecA [Candidatus Euphemobacter frigidus]MDP8275303.1 recombinase RecA [Candidatus Euphemobacter frigidus]